METKEILAGFVNYIFPKEKVEELAIMKLSKCNDCPIRNDINCSRTKDSEAVKDFIYKGEKRFKGVKYNGCGCILKMKVRSNSSCPIGNF